MRRRWAGTLVRVALSNSTLSSSAMRPRSGVSKPPIMLTMEVLPAPDPFAWTTAAAPLSYPTEARTRQFNLTHEWLAQVMLFGTWRVGGPAGVVVIRTLSMTKVWSTLLLLGLHSL